MTSNTNDGSLQKDSKAVEGSSNNSTTSSKQVSPEDLQTLKTMVHDFFHSPDLFIQNSPLYVKDYPSTEKIPSPSQYYDCDKDKDIPRVVVNQHMYCKCCSCDPEKVTQTSSSINRKLHRRTTINFPMASPAPPSPKGKGRKMISPEIVSKLPPPPFQARRRATEGDKPVEFIYF